MAAIVSALKAHAPAVAVGAAVGAAAVLAVKYFSSSGAKTAAPASTSTSATSIPERVGPKPPTGEERVALVTGASSGIGRDAAVRLASGGASIAIHYNTNKEGADETARLCIAAGAKRALIFQADLNDDSGKSAEGLVAAVLKAFGIIHIYVGNSGCCNYHKADSAGAKFADFRSHFTTLISTNLNGQAFVGYLVAQHMIDRSGKPRPEHGSESITGDAEIGPKEAIGSIVYVGSRGAFRGEPFAWGYGASKAGLHALAQCQARSLGKYGIVVNAIAPGFVATPFAVKDLEGQAGIDIKAQAPMNRVATSGEVAECIAFLSSYWSVPWITGAILDCNGASYLRT